MSFPKFSEMLKKPGKLLIDRQSKIPALKKFVSIFCCGYKLT